MNFFLWINNAEHGPFDENQIRAALDSGQILANQTARYEESNKWQPLSQILQVVQHTPAVAALPVVTVHKAAPSPKQFPLPPEYSPSVISIVFQILGALNFGIAFIGIFLLFGNKSESAAGFVIVVSGISGGFLLFAFAKVIECLSKAVYHLRNIEKIIYSEIPSIAAKGC